MVDPISWTWRHAILKSDLKPTTRHVLLTLSCFMNDVGSGCYPTTKKLTEATGLSERSVCTHLDLAFSSGWINRKRHGFAGQKWANHEYEPSFPGQKGAEPSSVRTCEGAEPNDEKALKEVQSKVPVIVSEDIPPIIPQDRFDDFWSVYPKKVGKPNARKAWAKAIKSHDSQIIIEAALAYALNRIGEDKSFTKHPQGWLNDERFLDDPGETKPPDKPGAALDAFKASIEKAKANGNSDITGSDDNRDRRDHLEGDGRFCEGGPPAGISQRDCDRLAKQIGFTPRVAGNGEGHSRE